jgi:hypothetical protein
MKKLSMILSGISIGVFLIVIMAVSMFACTSTRAATGTPSASDVAKIEQISMMLENRLYKVDFTRAFPMSGHPFTLTYPYYISIIGERVESFLPYFGRAYMAPYGGGEGLRFTAPIRGYKMKKGKRGQYDISFDAQTAEDGYTFNLEIYPTGESELRVDAMQKQSISFSGEIDMDPEFEAVRVE